MMNKNTNTMVIAGNSIEELEQGLKAMKTAITTGATVGVGGTSIADVTNGLEALKKTVRTEVTPKPHVAKGHGCRCACHEERSIKTIPTNLEDEMIEEIFAKLMREI